HRAPAAGGRLVRRERERRVKLVAPDLRRRRRARVAHLPLPREEAGDPPRRLRSAVERARRRRRARRLRPRRPRRREPCGAKPDVFRLRQRADHPPQRHLGGGDHPQHRQRGEAIGWYMIRPMTFRAVTFDCYGTLVDWETGIHAWAEKLLARKGASG